MEASYQLAKCGVDGSEGVKVSHLLFADDKLIFYEARLARGANDVFAVVANVV